MSDPYQQAKKRAARAWRLLFEAQKLLEDAGASPDLQVKTARTKGALDGLRDALSRELLRRERGGTKGSE